MKLTETERETIGFWEDVSELLGFTRSVGRVYGIYFLADAPLNADEIVEKTQISRSGAGQHIKTLVEMGALRVSQDSQHRKAHYELQTDLGILIRRLLNGRFLPKLVELNAQREALHQKALKLENETLAARFERLDRWKRKTEPAIGALKAFL